MYIENKVFKKYISYWLGSMFWIVSIMIIVGGLTRLTDSGLSITKWQLFTGMLPPLNNNQWNEYFELYKAGTLPIEDFLHFQLKELVE